MKSFDRVGGCLCGKVRYRLTEPLAHVLHCHCENCRRISGNFVAAAHVPTSAISLTSPHAEDHLEWYRLPYARYGFCRSCGSNLFWVPSTDESSTSLMVGTLDDGDDLALAGIWFAPEAQPHNVLPDGVPRFDGNGEL